MPRHTTNDPVRRAFHIAQGDAERRYAGVSPFNDAAWDEGGDADYFGNVLTTFQQVSKEMSQ